MIDTFLAKKAFFAPKNALTRDKKATVALRAFSRFLNGLPTQRVAQLWAEHIVFVSELLFVGNGLTPGSHCD